MTARRRARSGQIICSRERSDHVLPTIRRAALDAPRLRTYRPVVLQDDRMMPSTVAEVAAVGRRRRDRRWPPAIPLVIVVALVVCAVFAPLLAPRSPVEGSLGERLIPPLGMEGAKPGHPLGTDRLGRDTLS